MNRFIIFTPQYDPDSGGIIVLHKLCSVLNELGFHAELYPFFSSELINHKIWFKQLYGLLKEGLKASRRVYKTNPEFTTPIFKGRLKDITDNDVVIYPEIVEGNPLVAKNVVRWFLHKPGFHTGKIYYRSGELYFDFNSFAGDFCFHGSKVSSLRLYVPHIPIETYNLDNGCSAEQRKGTAYCLRKGKHKKIEHDLEDSVLIDGKSHQEISEIFKRVKTFISYDAYTGYSMFAALCGTDSVVIPDKGVTELEWYPEESQRYGIAYGFNRIDFARATRPKLLLETMKKENETKETVDQFAKEVFAYFK